MWSRAPLEVVGAPCWAVQILPSGAAYEVCNVVQLNALHVLIVVTRVKQTQVSTHRGSHPASRKASQLQQPLSLVSHTHTLVVPLSLTHTIHSIPHAARQPFTVTVKGQPNRHAGHTRTHTHTHTHTPTHKLQSHLSKHGGQRRPFTHLIRRRAPQPAPPHTAIHAPWDISRYMGHSLLSSLLSLGSYRA